MEIRIKRSFKQEMECNRIKLSILKRRTTNAVLIFFFLAILIIVANYFTINNFLLYLFGLLCICPGIGIIKFIGPSIKDAKNNINIQTKKNEEFEYYSELVLSNKYFFYKMPQLETNFPWKDFKRFIEYETCIYITSGKGFNSSFLIMRNEVAAEEFDNLLIFLNSTIKRF